MEFDVSLEPHLCGYRRVGLLSNWDCPSAILIAHRTSFFISWINNKRRSSAGLPTLVNKNQYESLYKTLCIFKSIQRFMKKYFCILNSTARGKIPQMGTHFTLSWESHFEYREKESLCFRMPQLEFIKPLHWYPKVSFSIPAG